MAEYWPHLPNTADVSCPVQFSEAELAEIYEQEENLFTVNTVVNYWHERVGGLTEEGWISNEGYDEAVRKIAELKEELIATADGDEEDLRLMENRDCSEIVRRVIDAVCCGIGLPVLLRGLPNKKQHGLLVAGGLIAITDPTSGTTNMCDPLLLENRSAYSDTESTILRPR
jgi:hypothetical protein